VYSLPVDSQQNILVLDDDELVSEYLGALLESESYHVTVLNEPVEALKRFIAAPDNFDLIITDQVMPELTGIEVAQAVLKLRPQIPVLLITGYSENINAENAKLFGLSGFFSKPINETQFLSEVRNLISANVILH
jgi:CheY-like chemotaxis protein